MRSHLLSLLALIAPLACSGGSSGDHMNPPPTSAKLQSLSITLDVTTPAAGELITVAVKGNYDDATTKDLTAMAMLQSTNTDVLEAVAGTPGQFKAKAMGTAQILASVNQTQASSTVMVGAPKVSTLELIPPAREVGIGATLKVSVVATYSDDSRETVTKEVQWATDSPGVLLPSATDRGYLVTFSQGHANITATLDGKSATGSYTVTPPRMEYATITPKDPRITQAMPVQFSATGHWSDGTTQDITHTVTWSSSDPAVATVDANGLATAVGDGNVVISAVQGDVMASTTAHTTTSQCPYPMDVANGVRYDSTIPAYFWIDGFNSAGTNVDFSMEDAYCNAPETKVLIFAVSAGWCPYCPAYMQMLDEMAPALEEAGAKIIYVVVETDSGAPANNMQANSIIERDMVHLSNSIRVGDGATQGGLPSPFSAAVETLPNAFVVRTRDMHVIAFQGQTDTTLDFMAIVNNPERLW